MGARQNNGLPALGADRPLWMTCFALSAAPYGTIMPTQASSPPNSTWLFAALTSAN